MAWEVVVGGGGTSIFVCKSIYIIVMYLCTYVSMCEVGGVVRRAWRVGSGGGGGGWRRWRAPSSGRSTWPMSRAHAGGSATRITELLRIVSYTISAANSWNINTSCTHIKCVYIAFINCTYVVISVHFFSCTPRYYCD